MTTITSEHKMVANRKSRSKDLITMIDDPFDNMHSNFVNSINTSKKKHKTDKKIILLACQHFFQNS